MLFLLSLSALAHESEPQHFVLQDSAELFSGAEYDTDWLPADSSLAVRFQIEATGGADVQMQGDGELTWPEALDLAFIPESGTGLLHQNADLDLVTSVHFDVAGYSWESEIDRRGISTSSTATFDPFLLDGADPDQVAFSYEGASAELISYDLNVFTGVTLVFNADVNPQSQGTFEGVSWQVGDDVIDEAGTGLLLTPEGDPSQAVEGIFTGAWTASLDLILTPSMQVCVDIIGCYDMLAFDLPIELASDDFQQAFPPTDLSFPLPMLVTELDDYDFGPIDVGDLANLQLPIGNAGDLYLEGFPGLMGSSYFSVYPEYVYAGPGQEDGIVISFAPETAGTFEATLLIESNDPLDPFYEIAIKGEGVEAEGAPDDSSATDMDSEDVTSEVRTCGCSAGTGGRALGLWAVLGVMLLARRRE